ERHVVTQPGTTGATDPPAPSPARLEQEDIVGVDVRPDTAAVARIREHRVIETSVGYEAKAREQVVRRVVVEVDPLNQQRPAVLRQRRQRATPEGPVPHR